MKKELEYSLADLLSIILKRIWIIVLCVAVFAVTAFSVSEYVIDEKFTATVSMYVQPKAESSQAAATLSDLNYAQKVVNTYVQMLKTNVFMEAVARETALGYSAGQLMSMVKMDSVNQTEIFRINVTSEDPGHSLLIAETIAVLAPQRIIEINNADAVRVVDPATLPTFPSSPNVLRNTAIGALIGLALSVALVLLLDMLDRRIKDEEDIRNNYDIPLLGVVPNFNILGV